MSSEQSYYVCSSYNGKDCPLLQEFTEEGLKEYLEELAPDVKVVDSLGHGFVNLESEAKKVFIIKGSLVSATPTEVKKTKWVIKENQE